MQYLLTEEEFKNMVPKQSLIERDEALELARNIILTQSNFNCIHDISELHVKYGGYCDDCPCSPIHEHDYNTLKHICKLPHNFSQ